MGATSTPSDLATLQAEYEALPNKRSREGVALRKAIAKAKASVAEERAPEKVPALEEQAEAVTPPISESVGVSSSSAEDVMIGEWTNTSTSSEPVSDEESIAPIWDSKGLGKTERTAVYWLGVLPGEPETGVNTPPAHQIDGIGGGLSFHEWWTPHEGKGQDGAARRGQYPGHLVELSESQVSQLREGLRCSLIRWRVREGVNRHGYVIRIPDTTAIEGLKGRLGLNHEEIARIKVRADQFRIEEHDEPVARYIYCVKVEGPEAVAGGTWRPSTTLPPSVEARGKIEGP